MPSTTGSRRSIPADHLKCFFTPASHSPSRQNTPWSVHFYMPRHSAKPTEFFDQRPKSSRPTRADKRSARKLLKEDRVFKRHGLPLVPKTPAQAEFLEALADNKVLLACGGAGVGKTYCAARYGLQKLLDGTYDRIIITRPMVPVSGEQIGFLPGDARMKTEPWAIPIMEAFRDTIPSKDELERMVKDGKIEFVPFAYIRGRTFNDCFVLADESQNLTIEQFKVLITRIGENCQIVVDGDLKQSDIRGANGLSFAIKIAEKYNLDAEIFEFEDSDVVRSEVVAQWVNAFTQNEKQTE